MAQPHLPPFQHFLQTIRTTENTNSLVDVLSLLFEPSPVLLNTLTPSLSQQLRDADAEHIPSNYAELVDTALGVVHGWKWSQEAEFVGGHPRIGEIKGLSAMSAVEQGQSQSTASVNAPKPTPPEVLERLNFLNSIFERRYPGLVYITFVNGRTRAQIRDEMEARLLEEKVLGTKDEVVELDNVQPHDVNGDEWRKEVTRAVDDVGKIAKDRLKKLGLP